MDEAVDVDVAADEFVRFDGSVSFNRPELRRLGLGSVVLLAEHLQHAPEMLACLRVPRIGGLRLGARDHLTEFRDARGHGPGLRGSGVESRRRLDQPALLCRQIDVKSLCLRVPPRRIFDSYARSADFCRQPVE
jgi:hypothetical protein